MVASSPLQTSLYSFTPSLLFQPLQGTTSQRRCPRKLPLRITQSNKIISLTTRSSSSLQDHLAHYKITQLTTRSSRSLQDHPADYKIISLTTRSPSSLQNHLAHYKIIQLTTRSPSSLQDHPAHYKSLALPPWAPHNSWAPYIDGHVDYIIASIITQLIGTESTD